MGKVIELDLPTLVDIPAEKILTKAVEQDLDHCVVVGYTQDGQLFFSSTTSNAANVVFMLEQAKFQLVSQTYESD